MRAKKILKEAGIYKIIRHPRCDGDLWGSTTERVVDVDNVLSCKADAERVWLLEKDVCKLSGEIFDTIKKLDKLMQYLNVELHTEEAKTFVRKKK